MPGLDEKRIATAPLSDCVDLEGGARSILSAVNDLYLSPPSEFNPNSIALYYQRVLKDISEMITFSNGLLIGLIEIDGHRYRKVQETLKRIESVINERGCLVEEHALPFLYELNETIGEMSKNLHGPASLLHQRLEKTIHSMIERLSDLKVITDIPRLSAQGVMRNEIFYTAKGVRETILRERGWGDIPIADLVIVGGSAGGLPSAYHAARAGMRTVVFEAGYFGQWCSDARAASTATLRTSALSSSLFLDGIVPPEVSAEVGLPAFMDRTKARVRLYDIRQKYNALINYRDPPGMPQRRDDGDHRIPIARGENFDYTAALVSHLSENPNIFLAEQCPVVDIDKLDDLYAVKLFDGTIQLARSIIIATGFVGSEAEWTRNIPALTNLVQKHEDNYVTLSNEHDVVQHFISIQNSHAIIKQPIINEALLGYHPIRSTIARLHPNTVVGIIGSGQSAVNAVMEVAALNPEVQIRLFTKHPLEPAQTHIPTDNVNPINLRTRLKDPRQGQLALEAWLNRYGTPVTPDSLLYLFSLIQQKRLILYEMGDHFTEDTVRLECSLSGRSVSTNIFVANPSVTEALITSRVEFADFEIPMPCVPSVLTGQLTSIDGPIIIAAGYDAKMQDQTQFRNEIRPFLSQQSQNRERKAYKNGSARLTSNPTFSMVGTCNLLTAADSTLFGSGARSHHVVSYLSAHLHRKGIHHITPLRDEEQTKLPVTWPFMRGSPRYPAMQTVAEIRERYEQGVSIDSEEALLLFRAERFLKRLNGTRNLFDRFVGLLIEH